MEDLDPELVAEFKTEAEEHLAQVEPALLEMESCDAARRQELVNQIFRAVHSVKGAAGFFNLDRIQSLAHAMENLLMRVRDGQLAFAASMTDPLLRGLDKLQSMLGALPAVADLSIEGEVEAVRAAASGASAPTPAPASAVTASPIAAASETTPPPAKDFELSAELCEEIRRFGQKLYAIRIPAAQAGDAEALAKLRETVNALGALVHESGSGAELTFVARSVLAPPLFAGELELPVDAIRGITLPTAAPAATSPAVVPLAPAAAAAAPVARADAANPAPAPREIESAPAQNASAAAPAREAETIRVNVRLLDKSIIELLSDPLTHLVRNALDHGLETPADRKGAGKGARGSLALRASHEGGQVHIEIVDDGRGIDPAKMRRAALEKGVISREELPRRRRQAPALRHAPRHRASQRGRGIPRAARGQHRDELGG
jgi:two-component system chemotaxis sensor kinase CheA